MAANDLKEFIRANPCKGFTPRPYYSQEGDFLAFHFRGVDHYAHRVDSALTVYLSMEEKKLVGFKIKGVQYILDTLGRFDIHRDVPHGDGTVRLHILLLPVMGMPRDPEAREYYEKIEEEARNFTIPWKELQPA